MKIARAYHFYNVLYIKGTSYDDIRTRLETEGTLSKHTVKDDDGSEIIVLGSTGFKKEQHDN